MIKYQKKIKITKKKVNKWDKDRRKNIHLKIEDIDREIQNTKTEKGHDMTTEKETVKQVDKKTDKERE